MLLSRLASHAFWLGRYLERSEAISRAIVAHDRMCLDLPHGAQTVSETSYQSLFVLCGAEEADLSRMVADRVQEGGRVKVLSQLLFENDDLVGVFPTLRSARENLRACRVLLPRETWDTLNPAFLQMADQEEGPTGDGVVESLEAAVAACQRITAQLSESMIRDEAYAFIRAGRYLERADMLMRVIQVADELGQDSDLKPFSNVRWMGLLHSLSAYQMYRRVHRGRTSAKETLSFLLQNRQFPRSLWFSLMKSKVALRSLPMHESLVDRCTALQELSVPRKATQPRQYTAHVISGLEELSEAIERTYFETASLPAAS